MTTAHITQENDMTDIEDTSMTTPKAAPAKKAPAKKAAPAKTVEAEPVMHRSQYTEAETDLRLTGHGPYQVMPVPDESDLADLTASIEKHGIMQPITVDEDGNIIDGHQRAMVAMKLGKDIPTKVVTGLSEVDKRSMAFTLNMARRHLTRQQKRDLVADSIKADPALSDRQHAERVGVSATTVGSIRSKLEESGAVSKLDTRVDKSGRKQGASKPTTPNRPAAVNGANSEVSVPDEQIEPWQPEPYKPWLTEPLTRRDGKPLESEKDFTFSDEKADAQAKDDAKYQHGVLVDLDKRTALVRGDLLSLRENWTGPISKADTKLTKSVWDNLEAALADLDRLAADLMAK